MVKRLMLFLFSFCIFESVTLKFNFYSFFLIFTTGSIYQRLYEIIFPSIYFFSLKLGVLTNERIFFYFKILGVFFFFFAFEG